MTPDPCVVQGAPASHDENNLTRLSLPSALCPLPSALRPPPAARREPCAASGPPESRAASFCYARQYLRPCFGQAPA